MGRSYLDRIEYTIIRNVSTSILAFTAEKFDMTFPYSVTVDYAQAGYDRNAFPQY